MITLKKSFEYQNRLSELLDEALEILSYEGNVTTIKQTHMRKKTYSEAEDEEIVLDKDIPYSINRLTQFVDLLMTEIETLTAEINKAKKGFSNSTHFDTMIAINNKKRRILNRYEMMAKIKSRETIVKGSADRFNEDGEQVSYRYDIKQVVTIDFDRNDLKRRISKLRNEVDKTSEEIDAMQINVRVGYDPIFDINDTLEELVLSTTE